VSRTQRLARIGNTVLSVGLNLVIERLGLDPRLRYALWALIAVNEMRGMMVVYQVGDSAVGFL
jgi:hypothetical protein